MNPKRRAGTQRSKERSLIRFTVRFPEELLSSLDEIARREGRSRSAVAREALNRYLHADSELLPRSVGMIKEDDGLPGSENVDEWLRANWHPE